MTPICPHPAQVELDADLKQLREQLSTSCTDPVTLCGFLITLEDVYCQAGEGLPKGELLECITDSTTPLPHPAAACCPDMPLWAAPRVFPRFT